MIECENLVKIFKTDETEVVALQGLDLTVETGELMAIIGNSGSGKSTLLNMLGGLDRPSAGRLIVDGKDLLKFNTRQYTMYKRETVGFVWQNNARNLIPYLTALENIELPMLISGRRRRERAKELLDIVGLSNRAKNKLAQLSGGEQQRIAIALSLANNPKLILADEPTGAVDSATAKQILNVFRDVNRSMNVTIVIVTHDRMLSSMVDRVVSIRDGRTSSEFIRTKSYLDELREIEEGIERSEQEEENIRQIEYAVTDNFGRVQLPPEYMQQLGMRGKSRFTVDLEDGKIVLTPSTDNKVERKA